MPNLFHRLRQACVLLPALACAYAHAEPFAYVPNEKSGTLSVIDTATDQVVRQIAAGKRPRGIAADPAGRQLFVTDAASSALLLIDNAGGAPVRSVALGKSPEGVSASHDGNYVAVAVEENNSVALLDGHTGVVLADIKVQGRNPEHAVFSPDGRWLLVSAEEAEQVDVIDVAQRRQVASVAVGLRPRGIGFSPDSGRAYVACELV
ncbi:MAG: cytochrome D1 domain-containing protein, partial [Janthinobacterium sp.]